MLIIPRRPAEVANPSWKPPSKQAAGPLLPAGRHRYTLVFSVFGHLGRAGSLMDQQLCPGKRAREDPRRAMEGGIQPMAQLGTVKWFSEEKGYGFITPDDGSEELFVHYSEIEGSGFRSLEEGEKVSYEAREGRKGLQATNVSKA